MIKRTSKKMQKAAKRLSKYLPARWRISQVGSLRIQPPWLMSIALNTEPHVNERWMLELLGKLPHEPGVFVDVGANIGQTLLSYKAAYPQGVYVGFEPNPFCIIYLHEVVRTNNLDNCTIIPAGLSDRTRSDRLYIGRHNLTNSGATVERDIKDIGKKTGYPVCLFRLDDTELREAEASSRYLLKIDAEGHENKVLAGGGSFIREHHPVIIMEALPPRNGEDDVRRTNIDQTNKMIEKLGYLPYRICISRGRRLLGLRKIDFIPSNVVSRKEKEFMRDYIFCHASRANELDSLLIGEN